MGYLLFWLHNLEDINTIWTLDNFAHSCQKHPLGLHKVGPGEFLCTGTGLQLGTIKLPIPLKIFTGIYIHVVIIDQVVMQK